MTPSTRTLWRWRSGIIEFGELRALCTTAKMTVLDAWLDPRAFTAVTRTIHNGALTPSSLKKALNLAFARAFGSVFKENAAAQALAFIFLAAAPEHAMSPTMMRKSLLYRNALVCDLLLARREAVTSCVRAERLQELVDAPESYLIEGADVLDLDLETLFARERLGALRYADAQDAACTKTFAG